jgi:bifunctional non-homologous end joining protein LigD
LPVEPECFQGIIVPRPGVPRGFRSLPQAVAALPGRSFLIDGEAIVTDDDGLAVFELIRRKRHGDAAVLIAFDLIELDGRDLRREPIEHRKHKLS